MQLSVAPLIRRQQPTVRCTWLCLPRFRLWLRIDLRPRQTLPVCTANGCRRMMRSGSPVKLLVHCWRTKRPKTQKVVQLFSFFLGWSIYFCTFNFQNILMSTFGLGLPVTTISSLHGLPDITLISLNIFLNSGGAVLMPGDRDFPCAMCEVSTWSNQNNEVFPLPNMKFQSIIHFNYWCSYQSGFDDVCFWRLLHVQWGVALRFACSIGCLDDEVACIFLENFRDC